MADRAEIERDLRQQLKREGQNPSEAAIARMVDAIAKRLDKKHADALAEIENSRRKK